MDERWRHDMFKPPEEIQAEVFAVLPSRFRRKNQQTAWAAARRGGRPIDSFLEGPSFDRKGNLYVTDIPFGRIFCISPDGDWKLVTEYDGEPNGLKIHRDGRAFITDFRNGIVELDLETGATKPSLERRYTERFKGVNDLFFAANGDMYFTDQGRTGYQDSTGRVYRWSADGRLHCLLNSGVSPNGLVTNADESVLYVAMSNANAVWHLSLMPNDDVTTVGNFVQLSGGGGPDGLALTEDGGLVVAQSRTGIVWVFDAQGRPRYRVNTAASEFLSNVAFGGPDNRTLYITDSNDGLVQRAYLPIAGRRMFSHT
jgi:gluconolactonase